MPSKKPVIAYRPELATQSQLEQLSNQLGLPLSQVVDIAVKEYINRSNTSSTGCNTLETIQDKDNSTGVTPSVCVCVGDKLDTLLLLEPYVKHYTPDLELLIFPKEQIVAIADKSANGNRKYLKVARVYSDEVWRLAKITVKSSQPLDRLELVEQLLTNPVFIEATAKGYSSDFIWTSTEILEDAKDYLRVNSTSKGYGKVVTLESQGINSQELGCESVVQMAREEFRAKYNLLDSREYNSVVTSIRQGNSYDGYSWTATGKGKDTILSGTRTPSLTPDELQVVVQ